MATRTGHLLDGTACEKVDFNAPTSLPALLDRMQPEWVINAAAYTAVDAAEKDVANAYRANSESPGVIAGWCARHCVPMVHYSTDYVFDGSGVRPYREDDPAAPLGVYGLSKRDGEEAIRGAGGRHLIFRTAWVYAEHSANFLRTMLRLAGEHERLRVVDDQYGTPTPAALIADVTAQAIQHAGQLSGTWHLTAGGRTSWYGFAEAIFAEAAVYGVLAKVPTVEPIDSSRYPTPARRPAWSVLDNHKVQRDLGINLPDWRDALKQVMAKLAMG